MINRIVLGNDTELPSISDIQESTYNTGEFIKRSLTLNTIGESPMSLTDIETLLRAEGALSTIKVFKKDRSESMVEGEVIVTYGDEYLDLEYTQYTNIQSIIRHSSNGMISIILIIDPTDISGDKAKSLEAENDLLRAQNNALNDRQEFLEDVIAEMLGR